MSEVNSERLTVQRDEGFVVFLIGARANRWWNLPALWMVGSAMTRMMRELANDPESGLLSSENYSGRTTLSVQYWRSVEDLQNYARDREKEHLPVWRNWIKRWSEGAIGIWHETYVIKKGSYECVYQHMPPFGLGRVGPLVPAEGPLKTAALRLKHGTTKSETTIGETTISGTTSETISGTTSETTND